MGTSRLSNELQTCIGGALVFSGRPNPTWPVEQAVVRELEETWDSLEPFRGKCPSAPPLDYRGCFLRCARNVQWVAYQGVVTLKTDGGRETRRDKDRKFERVLLASAPKGVLPTPLVENI